MFYKSLKILLLLIGVIFVMYCIVKKLFLNCLAMILADSSGLFKSSEITPVKVCAWENILICKNRNAKINFIKCK